MKSSITLLLVGLGALVFQGGIATFLPPPWCPNLSLLVVIGIGLHWPGMMGALAIASVLGYATDLVSGSLLGQHALDWLVICGAARVAGRRLNLRGALPLAAFAAGTTFFFAASQLFLTGFFTESAATLGWGGTFDVAKHALVNAAAAPMVSGLVGWVLAWSGDEEARPLAPARTRI